MSIDEQEEGSIMDILRKVATPFILLGYAGQGLYDIVAAFGSQSLFGGASQPLVQELRKEVEAQFCQYINTALTAAQDSLQITTKREKRLKLIIE